MATTRTTFSLDEELAERARGLNVNVSAAAREGVAAAVRSALARADRRAYIDMPESVDTFWTDAERHGDQLRARLLIARQCGAWLGTRLTLDARRRRTVGVEHGDP